MEVEWNGTKAATNLRKHKIDFADAATVLHDEHAITIEDDSAEGEVRWISIGADAMSRVLVVAYTWRGDRVRIISARKATRSERRQYEGPR